MRQGDPLDADHVEEGDSYSVGVLTRGAARAAIPLESPSRTFPLPTAESMRDASEMPANTVRGDVVSVEELSSSVVPSPYGSIPDALTSHLLHLQSRDAFCEKRAWERLSNGEVTEPPFKGKWTTVGV
jgi:hypothetical protein